MSRSAWALPDSSLIALRLGVIPRVFCDSPVYLSTRGTPRTPNDLAWHVHRRVPM
jgi:hypothetical protein